MVERLKRLFGYQWAADVANTSQHDNFNEITTLSWDLRVQCFLGCFCLSLICSLAGSALLFTWRVTGFTVMVSLGSILSLLGTCFLMGPLQQLRKMFERGRFFASLMYVLAIAFTLLAGLFFGNPSLAFIFVIGQYIAMTWYSITYIPFAREAVSSLCCKCSS